jgi:hypothetical protein
VHVVSNLRWTHATVRFADISRAMANNNELTLVAILLANLSFILMQLIVHYLSK